MSSGVVVMLAIYLVLAALYFVPSFVAFRRRHPNRWVIFAINLTLGATGIAWIGCLVWALGAVHLSTSGSRGGESGLNVFANDPVKVRFDGEPVIRAKPATDDDPGTQLARLKRLRDEGIIDEQEYRTMRKPYVDGFGRSG